MAWKWWVKPVEADRDLVGEEKARAQKATAALPVMREAYGEVRGALVDQMIMTGPMDAEAREYFYHAVKGLDAVVAMVEAYARSQDMAVAMEAYKQKVVN